MATGQARIYHPWMIKSLPRFLVLMCLTSCCLLGGGSSHRRRAPNPPPTPAPTPTPPPAGAHVPGSPIPDEALRPLEAGTNWDYSTGTLGWAKTGAAFDNQPTVGDNVFASRIGFGRVGGDYFDVPYPIGNNGKSWLGTFENHPDDSTALGTVQGDAPQGTLTSGPFRIEKPIISFLIGGGEALGRLGVILLVENRGTYSPTKFRATGMNSEILRREVWNVAELRGSRARIHIVDLSSDAWGHTNVADIRFHDTDPRQQLAWAEVAPGRRGLVDPETAVFGLADLHTHPAAHLAFGGNLYFGEPMGPIARTLGSCERHHNKSPTDVHIGPAEGFFIAIGNAFTGFFEGFTAFIMGNAGRLRSKLYELDGPLHSGVGYPALQSWRFYNRTHQHMHIDWIRRAYDGGLRLMVADAVHNALLAEVDPRTNRRLIGDRESADAQIDYIKRMALENSSWMEIAYDPAKAREIIRNGKLALILGIEVDALGNLNERGGRRELLAELDRLHALGVRHIFPVHLTDSIFGGCAIYGDLFNLNNFYMNGRLFRVRNGRPEGIRFRLEAPEIPGVVHHIQIELNSGRRLALGDLGVAYDGVRGEYRRPSGHANAQGLTEAGRAGIEKLMSQGMLIDVDHMSALTLNEVLTLAENRSVKSLTGYPVVSGHCDFRELQRGARSRNDHALAHECSKARRDAERIVRLGGIMAPITSEHELARATGCPVEANAPGTSKDLAQMIHYAVEVSGGRGVGLGTDLALLGGFGPRFGADALPALVVPKDYLTLTGEREDFEDDLRNDVLAERRSLAFQQDMGVRYDSPIRDYRRYRFFWTHGNTGKPIYKERQRDFWEALAIWDSGTDPERADQPGILQNRSLNTASVVRAFAHGFRAERAAQITGRGALGSYYAEKRAAFLCRHQSEEGRDPGGPEEDAVRELLADLRPIWNLWCRMKDQSTAPPIRRLVYEGTVDGKTYVRDFDINIDGFAHYGMLPDALQELRNVGLQQRHFSSLFRSAEEFLKTWERCWSMRTAR